MDSNQAAKQAVEEKWLSSRGDFVADLKQDRRPAGGPHPALLPGVETLGERWALQLFGDEQKKVRGERCSIGFRGVEIKRSRGYRDRRVAALVKGRAVVAGKRTRVGLGTLGTIAVTLLARHWRLVGPGVAYSVLVERYYRRSHALNRQPQHY